MRSRFLFVTILLVCSAFWASHLHAGEPADGEVDSINGKPFEAIVTSLRNASNTMARTGAMMDIARYANHPDRYLDDIKTALVDSDPIIRASAAQTLGALGQRRASLVKYFLEDITTALSDESDLVRSAATNAAGQIGVSAYGTTTKLSELQKSDPSKQIRQEALGALVRVTRGTKDQQLIVRRAVQQKEFPIRAEWIAFLDDSNDTIDVCRTLLHNSDNPRNQLAATARLARAGGLAAIAANDLIEVFNQPIQYEQVFAKPPVGESLQHPKLIGREPKFLQLQLAAAWAITQIDSRSSERLFADVQKRLMSKNADDRLLAAITVSRLSDNPQTKPLIVTMSHLQEDNDVRVRTVARLGYLRLVDEGFQGQRDSRLGRLPLPADGASLPTKRVLLDRLHADLDRYAKGLQQQLSATEAWLMLCDFITPDEVEAALIQGGYINQMERKRKVFLRFAKELADVDRERIQITGRTAYLPLKGQEGKLYYFDGSWKLLD